MNDPKIAVLSGGVSGEREVSKRSAAAVAEALGRSHQVEIFDVLKRRIPEGIDPSTHVVFPALHGVFGEDGGMQELLEKAGFAFAGGGSRNSRLCMNKAAAKAVAAEHDVTSAQGLLFSTDTLPGVGAVIARFGAELVLKPNSEGSSLGLEFVSGEKALASAFENLTEGEWLIEERVCGRELTVGILHGRAMGVVEILPRTGRYDYASKYTSGMTDFEFPAALPNELTSTLRREAETVFAACDCRDFARVDFILPADGRPYFLEINTIPGLTETSLLPKSASCEGYDFQALAEALVAPALERFVRVNGEVVR